MSLPEGFSITTLYEGGAGYNDREGVFTQRTTYAVVNPEHTRAVRVQAERTIDRLRPDLGSENGYVTQFYPINVYEGAGIGFDPEVGDSVMPPKGEVSRKFMLGYDEGVMTRHTLYREFDRDITAKQREQIAGVVGVAALDMHSQMQAILGEGQ